MKYLSDRLYSVMMIEVDNKNNKFKPISRQLLLRTKKGSKNKPKFMSMNPKI